MNLKDIFDTTEDGTLTYAQFESALKEKGWKLADLSEGKYVSKSKYDADLKEKDTQIEAINAQIEGFNSQIENLNSTIATRDDDLGKLQKQLEEAGQDATKLADLSTEFSNLQNKYTADVESYQNQLKQQAYEFAVKEFANTKKFSSEAAKRDFTRSMIAKGLNMEDGKILGREDFAEKYLEENSDAFVVDVPAPVVEPQPEPEPVVDTVDSSSIPQFVASTSGPIVQDDDVTFDFGFQGVRAHN